MEVGCFVLFIICFTTLPSSTLLFLQSVFLARGQFEVAVLESALIRTKSRISGRQLGFQLIRDVIRLERKISEIVKVLAFFWPRSRLIQDFLRTLRQILQVDHFIPLAVNLVLIIASLERGLNAELARTAPSSLLENHADLVWAFADEIILLVNIARNSHRAHMLEVHGSHQDIVHVDVRSSHIEQLVVCGQTELSAAERYQLD